MTSWAERRAAALARLHAGDAPAAFQLWQAALAYPAVVSADELADGLGVLAQILVAADQRELAERAARASVAPTDADTYYDLGFELIEAELPGLAATVLTRCLVLSPNSVAVVTELCAALERDLRHADACAVLATHPGLVDADFVCRYLYAFNAIMCGELAIARALMPGLVAVEPRQTAMVERIAGMLARAARVEAHRPLDDRDLRGWHHVITGGLLLHRSPYGLDGPMFGRYALVHDQPALVGSGVATLVEVLATWGFRPPCVFAPSGPGHGALAARVGAQLGVEVAPWPMVGVPAPGLVVTYALTTLTGAEQRALRERRPGQLWYAHAGCWTQDAPVAPDIVNFLYQHLRPIDDAAIAGAVARLDDEAAITIALARTVTPADGDRQRWWAGGPVPSNRF